LLQADDCPRWPGIKIECRFHAATVGGDNTAKNRQDEVLLCRYYLVRFGRPGSENVSPIL
jgi:hypothetical protein